jgi:hypothetical protein
MRPLALIAVAVIVAGCYYGDPGATADPGVPWSLIGFTQAGNDTMHVSGDTNAVTVTAPASNREANTRIGWVVDQGPFERNEVCATWQSHSGSIDQPGLVVHFDGTHAITVTQNIWMADRSAINVHAWDLSKPVDNGRFTLLKSVHLDGIGDGQGWPLRACARAVGPFLDFKVWPAGWWPPDYGDPAFSSGSLIIDQPGSAGWYAGHVAPGGSMRYTDLTETHG